MFLQFVWLVLGPENFVTSNSLKLDGRSSQSVKIQSHLDWRKPYSTYSKNLPIHDFWSCTPLIDLETSSYVSYVWAHLKISVIRPIIIFFVNSRPVFYSCIHFFDHCWRCPTYRNIYFTVFSCRTSNISKYSTQYSKSTGLGTILQNQNRIIP